MLSLQDAMIATIGCALVIFLTRLFPFALFSKRNPPKILQFVAKYLPPMVMAVLILPLIVDVDGIWAAMVVAEAFAVIVTALFMVMKRKKYKIIIRRAM